MQPAIESVKFRALQHTAHRVHTDLFNFIGSCQLSDTAYPLLVQATAGESGAGSFPWPARLRPLEQHSASTCFTSQLSARAGGAGGALWRLNSATVQRLLWSAGAHYLPQVLVVGRQQRLQLLADNGFEITGRMLCAEAVFEGYLKVEQPSLLELLLLVHLVVYVRDRSDRHAIKYGWALNLEHNCKLNADLNILNCHERNIGNLIIPAAV
jgi:hypothetical protein